MAEITASTPQRLELQSGSTRLTLDKNAGKAILERKLLLWSRKPQEAPLSELRDVAVSAAVDRASGVEICATILIKRDGQNWTLPAADKGDAERTTNAVRMFLGLAA